MSTCPDAELCIRLKRHIHGNLWKIWNSDSPLAYKYKNKWLAHVGLPPEFSLPKPPSKPTQPPTRRELPCVHEGAVLEFCKSCGSKEGRHVRECDIHERCTRDTVSPNTKSCTTCPDFKLPSFIASFDETTLNPELPGKRFNASIIAFDEGYALAWRDGWKGSEIFITKLDAKFKPIGSATKLHLFHKHANYGREDPRLFWFRNQLHIMYIGVVGVNGPTNVLYARLDDDFKVEQIFAPHFPQRKSWEKNWEPFEYDGDLYFVYSVKPHKVLKVEGEKVVADYTTDPRLEWKPQTEIRGGTSPVLIDDEWWCFFHSKREQRYNIGLYTFENKPPFKVKRIIPDALIWSDPATNVKSKLHDKNYTDVVFSCGAVYRENGDSKDWIISLGRDDRYTELHKFDHNELLSKLVPVRSEPPPLPPIYCVTLSQTPKRKAAAEKHFSERGLKVEMFQGVHGETWGLATTQNSKLSPEYKIPPGMIGCNLSHWMLWNYILHRGDDIAIVLEDDAYFDNDFADKYTDAIATLPESWQIAFLGSVGTEKKNRTVVNDKFVTCETPFGVHAYAIKKSAIPTLLSAMQSTEENTDILLYEKVTKSQFPCYVAWPNLVRNLSVEGIVKCSYR